MRYKWVLFDADETLFHFDAYAGLQRMFSEFDIHFSEQDFAEYQKVNKPLWVDYQDGKINAKQLQVTRFQPWADKLSVEAEHLNARFLNAMADICTLLPGAHELLTMLQAKAHVGIITNGFTDLQSIRLERTGVKDLISTVVISEEVGIAKPDAGIFHHTFELLGNPAREQILMVGDNPHSDVLGGMNVGIDTCWLNTSNSDVPEGIYPTYNVQSLPELQNLLFA